MLKETVLARSLRVMFSGGKVIGALGGAVVGAICLIEPAFAQEPDASNVQTQRIEITGSSIKRIQIEGALPVQTFTRADIEKTGATSVAELMGKIPAMQGFTEAGASVGGGGLGLSTANLHSIGSNRTLVLLNGRRLATSGQQSLTGNNAAINLNTIPLGAIDRVEVLTDGASAIYGSDAIGGVVNFILRNNYQGGEITAGVFLPKAGAQEKSISFTGGLGDLAKDGYNIIIAASHDERTALKAGDRSFTKTKTKYFSENGIAYSLLPSSTYSSPGNFESNEGEFRGLRNTYLEANGVCPVDHVKRENRRATGTFYCAYDTASPLEIYPEMSRDTALLSGKKSLGADATLFASLVYGKSTVRSVRAAPPPDITVDPTSPFYSGIAALGYTGEMNVRWRALDAGKRTVDYIDQAFQFVAGIEGNAFGWDYSIDYNRSQSKAEQNLISGNLTKDGLDTAIYAGTINPFAAPGGQSAAGLKTLQEIQATGYYSGGTSTLEQFSIKGSRPLFKLSGGDMQIGTGLSYIRDHTQHNPSLLAQQLVSGGLADELTSELKTDVSRQSVGGFAELVAPISSNFELTTALRSDHFSDFSNSTNYKVGARFTPSTSWLFRASAGSGFHAPTASQLSNIRQIAGEAFADDCPFPAADPRAATCNGSGAYKVFEAGNPNLKPESSKQWTIGTRFEPSSDITIGVDLWNVRIQDRIGGSPSDAEVFADYQRYSKYYTTFNKGGVTELALIYPNENGGIEQFRGVDLDARFRFKTPIGKLKTSVYGTYMLQSDRQHGVNTASTTDLGVADGLGNVTLRFIGSIANTLDVGNFSHTLTFNYKSGYDEVFNTVEVDDLARRVKTYKTFDWQTRFKLNKSWTIVAGVYNLLNEDPPFSGSGSRGFQPNYNSMVANPRGRAFALDATVQF